jgi:hypothetical protein
MQKGEAFLLDSHWLPEEIRRFALPLLLFTFPFAVALAGTPLLCGMVFVAFLLLAYQLKCVKPLGWVLLVSFLINACFFSGAVIHFDTDAYIAPQIRLIASPYQLSPDGFYYSTHLSLPRGYSAWCATLYRLTGSVDCGAMLIWMLIPAAWLVLRAYLTRLQTALLLISPALFPSLFNLMSDGAVYLLLLIALVALVDRSTFWVPLLAAAGAALCKTSAWIPCAFIGVVLFQRFPARWWKLGAIAAFVCCYNYPTIVMMMRGGLSEISADFDRANEAAKAMGYWARLAYVYIGHWTSSAQPHFGAHLGGVDGGGADGFGPVFRIAVVASIGCLILGRKQLKSWFYPLLIAWGSVLVMPTLYIGYARYTPWLYPAVMLPLVLLVPRLTIPFNVLLCIYPMMWLGWRVALSSEVVRVATHATAVQSDVYNIRCFFRDKLVASAQPTSSGSLFYTYAMDKAYFPPIQRTHFEDLKSVSPFVKATDVRKYMLTTWLPWFLCHFHEYWIELITLRYRWLVTPRGQTDELSPTHN